MERYDCTEARRKQFDIGPANPFPLLPSLLLSTPSPPLLSPFPSLPLEVAALKYSSYRESGEAL